MYSIDNQSRLAVYEQVIAQTERFILTEVLTPGQPLPSVRSLSMELSVNPNTVQKAYSELERRGIIYPAPGKGSFIADDAKSKLAAARMIELESIEHTAYECALAGIDKNLVYEAVDKGYSRNGVDKI